MSMYANRPPQVTFGGFSRRKKIAPPNIFGDNKDEDSFDGSACDGHDVCRLGEYVDIGHDVCRLVVCIRRPGHDVCRLVACRGRATRSLPL